MKKRVISAIVMIVIAVVAIYFGGYVLGAVVLYFAAVGLYEFYRAFKKKGFNPIMPIGFLYLGLIPVVVFLKPAHALEIPVLGTNIFPAFQMLVVLALLLILVVGHKKYTPVDCAITLLGGFYVPFLFSFFNLTRNMEDGMFLMIIGIVGSVLADTFALFGGKLFGKKKLVPEISPKKTVAGCIAAFIGALVSVTAYGVILHFTHALTHPIGIEHFAILGLLMGGTSQVGDLSASVIKRYCGLKDFGNSIPGHGGILDRFDSMLFNMPLVYCYLVIMNAVTI